MACFRPVGAWQTAAGGVVFGAEPRDCRAVVLPCGQCIGCRLVRVRSWALRCMHEASLHASSAFVTLTYDDDHVSPHLRYPHFQQFLRAYRYRFGRIRYFVAGEYGALTNRPHFHALLFGARFSDGVPCRKDLYQSPTLDSLWGRGFASFGAVTYESAAYVAKYCVSTAAGPPRGLVDVSTGEVVPMARPFAHMSTNPGIGHGWYDKYWREVYQPRDGVVRVGGSEQPPPRYYDKLFQATPLGAEWWEEIQFQRLTRGLAAEAGPSLASRELCAWSNYNRKARAL